MSSGGERKPAEPTNAQFVVIIASAIFGGIAISSVVDASYDIEFWTFVDWAIQAYQVLRELVFLVIIGWFFWIIEFFLNFRFELEPVWKDIFSISFIYVGIQVSDVKKGAMFTKTGRLWRAVTGVISFFLMRWIFISLGISEQFGTATDVTFGVIFTIALFRLFTAPQIAYDTFVNFQVNRGMSLEDAKKKRREILRSKTGSAFSVLFTLLFWFVWNFIGWLQQALQQGSPSVESFQEASKLGDVFVILALLPALAVFHIWHLSSRQPEEPDPDFWDSAYWNLRTIGIFFLLPFIWLFRALRRRFGLEELGVRWTVSRYFKNTSGTFIVGGSLLLAGYWGIVLVVIFSDILAKL